MSNVLRMLTVCLEFIDFGHSSDCAVCHVLLFRLVQCISGVQLHSPASAASSTCYPKSEIQLLWLSCSLADVVHVCVTGVHPRPFVQMGHDTSGSPAAPEGRINGW